MVIKYFESLAYYDRAMTNSPELIVMLTYNDFTVKNAAEIFEACKDSKAKYWGLKEQSLSFDELKKLGVVQSEHALDVLWFSYVMIPALGCLIALVIWNLYKLNDKDVQVMADCNAGKIDREEAEESLSRKY